MTLSKELDDVLELAIKIKNERDRLRDLVKQIQDALGTAEEGENLVSVARDAARAEMELAARIRVEEEADELCAKVKG